MQPCSIAILYQALSPPVLDGLRKDAKPGGYSDGGADIGFALAAAGQRLVTPVAEPDPVHAFDWVFPDTADGISAAQAAGADVLWANTVLFEGHPLEAVLGTVAIVGQIPRAMQRFDDKFATNHALAQAGLPVARSFLLAAASDNDLWTLASVDRALAVEALEFPLIVKPVRGRGSQGVTLVEDLAALRIGCSTLLDLATFGDRLMIEEYLDGEEFTVTVLPPASPTPTGASAAHWPLRPVRRFDQIDGVAPYNGDVPVSANSEAIDAVRARAPDILSMQRACADAASFVDARAPIRIDCRANRHGHLKIFDLNMKPNMTGPGRPGRDDQTCLSALAARAEGWTYTDLLLAMLAAAWRG